MLTTAAVTQKIQGSGLRKKKNVEFSIVNNPKNSRQWVKK